MLVYHVMRPKWLSLHTRDGQKVVRHIRRNWLYYKLIQGPSVQEWQHIHGSRTTEGFGIRIDYQAGKIKIIKKKREIPNIISRLKKLGLTTFHCTMLELIKAQHVTGDKLQG